jgi:LmbE family N-acetylglucosaminyl deacetylase
MGTLLVVFAHPDDEIGTSGAMMKAKAHGHRVVLVTATRGEVGEIYNMEEAAARPRLAEIRTEELNAADEIIGLTGRSFSATETRAWSTPPTTKIRGHSIRRSWTRR